MIRRITTTLTVTTAALAATAATAFAHIEAYPTTTDTGLEPLVRFIVPHSCDGKPTTKIEIQFPDEVVAVRPIQSALWTVSDGTSDTHKMSGHDMSSMKSGEHMEMSSSSTSGGDKHLVTWSAKQPLAATDLGTIEALLVLPATADTLWMPAVQTCQGGAKNS